MPSKAHNNGAAPPEQPFVRTLDVPDFQSPRIEAKPEVIERLYDDSVQEPFTASEKGLD